MDRDLAWGIHSDSNLPSLDAGYGNPDLIADRDALTQLPCQYEHIGPSLAK
jgi:hypothetical protein